jgi:anti-sigma regulatory factor (Ser/Thr protein kinase)
MSTFSTGDTGGVPALMDVPGIRRAGWAFTPIVAASTRARRRLADQLHLWGITGSASESVLLVANELVANAVDHARTDFELAVTFDGTAIVVEVHDQSMLQPCLQPFNPTAARGRGLQLVNALAKSWRCIRHAGGKTVQAVIVLELLLRCAMISLGAGGRHSPTSETSQRPLLGGASFALAASVSSS